MFATKKASVQMDSDPTVRRSYLSKELVTTPAEGVETVADVLPYCARTYGDKTAAITRSVINIVTEKKQVPKKGGAEGEMEEKSWNYFTLSPPTAHSYSTLHTRVKHVSSGLRHLGLGKNTTGGEGPDEDVDGRERVGVYADTSLNWQLMLHSLARMGHPLSTAYTTLGPEGLQHSLAEPSVRLLFTNSALLPTLLKVLPECPALLWVVYDNEDKADKAVVEKIEKILKERRAEGKCVGLDVVEASGKADVIEDGGFGAKPKRDDLFCIMYTSGSTGAPKGVMLTHNNIICSLAGTKTLLKKELLPTDLFLAFLPLAHILELLVELTFYFLGVPVGYGTTKTLTNESVRECEGDLVAFKPTIIVGVPAIYELIRKGMYKKISESPAPIRTIFNLAYSMKRNVPVIGPALASPIFAKVKAATGGRLRLAMNGGAALSKSTQEFLNTTLVTMLQGYGATETCGMAAILVPGFYQTQSVGVIVPSMEVKLNDYPEAGYLSSNKPPQGEVWLRGGSVTKGYYKRDDLNKESFTEDGWFKTGDIGQFAADGTLSLIDRIKNLVKLRSGEYLALEKCESTYGSCNIVSGICVYANSDEDKPVAIVLPHEGNLRNYLKTNNIDAQGELDDLCKNQKVRDVIYKELINTGKAGGLKGPELLQALVLEPGPWTPDDGSLTAANKLNRNVLVKRYMKDIQAAYRK